MAQQPVDAQTLSDTTLEIFEAVATLEYIGRRPSRSAITAAAHKDEALVDEALDEMTAHGLLTRSDRDGEAVYVPASRDWSTQPNLAAGHPLG